jgi:hypothetical protein
MSMLRRSFFKSSALALLAVPAASRTRAAASPSPRAELVELAGAAALGAAAAKEFLRFAETRRADASLADCAASGAEMRAACDALAALAASDAPFAYGFARTAADLCAASRKDCEKFSKIAECATFATAAAVCEAACRKAADGSAP